MPTYLDPYEKYREEEKGGISAPVQQTGGNMGGVVNPPSAPSAPQGRPQGSGGGGGSAPQQAGNSQGGLFTAGATPDLPPSPLPSPSPSPAAPPPAAGGVPSPTERGHWAGPNGTPDDNRAYYRDHRQRAAQKQAEIEAAYREGRNLESLGYKNVHEQGQTHFAMEQALDSFGPAYNPSMQYDLQNGLYRNTTTSGVDENGGYNTVGGESTMGWQRIPPEDLKMIREFQAWKESPEGQGFAAANGGSAYRGWQRKQYMENQKRFHLSPLAGGQFYYGLDARGQVRHVMTPYGEVVPPESLPPAVRAELQQRMQTGQHVGPNAGQGGQPQPQPQPQGVPGAPGAPPFAPPVVGPPAAPAAAAPGAPLAPVGAPVQGQMPMGDALPPQAPLQTPSAGTFPAAQSPEQAPAAAMTQPGAPAAPAAPQEPMGTASNPFRFSYTPKEHELASLPPDAVIETPDGTIASNADGKRVLRLNEAGKAKWVQLHQQRLQKFGPRPLADDPTAPQPPVVPGRLAYNPFNKTNPWIEV